VGASQFCKFALFPPPLLPKWEQGSRIQSPSPALGEGFRVRGYKSGMHPVGVPALYILLALLASRVDILFKGSDHEKKHII
jgi:hypothetical protein